MPIAPRRAVRTLSLVAIGVPLALGPAAPAAAAPPVTLETLLEEMLDRDALARLPEPAYRAVQFSSYDRATVSPDASGWFANWDRSMFLRTETRDGRTEHVMVDAAGPGALVRFWATFDGAKGRPFSNGMLRIYLDDETTPRFAGRAIDMLSGGALCGPPLSQFVSPDCPPGNRAHNLYLPISFAQRCVVTYETDAPIDPGAQRGGEAIYYQAQCRLYAAGTAVESLTPATLAAAAPALARANAALADPAAAFDRPRGIAHMQATLQPEERGLFRIDGPSAIRELVVRLDADDPEQALRSTVFELVFDGERTAWCPVGAFFGCGSSLAPFRSWWTERAEDGTMSARWAMPFDRAAEVHLVNYGEQPVRAEVIARHGPWKWTDRSLHFHATWRELWKQATRPLAGDGSHAEDVRFVGVDGAGVYAGDVLEVFNAAAAWWGEGDEKVWVDGESFPAFVGTGTEDYYGYAWCRPEPFSAPFHAQPTGAGNFTPGRSVNLRVRGLDAIPFTSSLRFDMELWHWTPTKVNYAPTCWFYARPGATVDVPTDIEGVRRPIARARGDLVEIFRAEGAIEGEAMEVASRSGGVTEIQDIPQFQWSDDKQLWWRDAKPGDAVVLAFEAPETGRFRVIANLTRAIDYGIVRLAVNGVQAPELFDGVGEGVTHGEVDLGVFPIQAGRNDLHVEIVGTNPRAVPKHMFGLDYIRLVPAE